MISRYNQVETSQNNFAMRGKPLEGRRFKNIYMGVAYVYHHKKACHFDKNVTRKVFIDDVFKCYIIIYSIPNKIYLECFA